MQPFLFGLAFVLLTLGVLHLVMAARRFFLIYLKARKFNGSIRWMTIIGLIIGLACGYLVIASLIIAYPLEFERNLGGSLFIFGILALIAYFLMFSLGTLDRLIRKVREEGERSQKFIEISGIIVVGLDKDANVTFINRKGCEILGREEKDIIGKNWIDEFLPKSSRAEVREVFLKVMSGQLDLTEFHDNPVLRSDGSIRMIEWHNSTIKDAAGIITGVLSAGNDVTERLEIADKLVASATALSRAEAFAKVGHWEWDIVTGEMHWSDSLLAIGGLPIGTKPTFEKLVALIHPDDRGRIVRLVEEYRKKSKDFETVMRFRRDGATGWAKLTGQVFRDASGKATRMIGIVMDVTDLEEARLKLERRNRLESLVADIAMSFSAVSSGGLDAAVDAAIRQMGEAMGIGGVVVFLQREGTAIEKYYEWIESGERLLRGDVMRSDILGMVSGLKDAAGKEGAIVVESLSDLPPEAGAVKAQFTKCGIKSSLMMFLKEGTRVVGLVCCHTFRDEHKWTDEDVRLMTTVGSILPRVIRQSRQHDQVAAEREKFETLFESLPDASLIYSPASDAFVEVNSAAVRIFRYRSKDDLLGKSFADIAPAIQPDGRPSRDVAMKSLKDASAGGVASVASVHKRGDGTEFPSQTQVIPVEYGGELMYQGIIRDVTEERRLAKSIEDSEKRYRSLVDNIADTVFSYDLSGKIFYISPQVKVFGFTPAEVVGKNIRDFIHSDDIGAVLDGVKDLASRRNDRLDLEVRIRSKDGWRWTETASVIRLDDRGNAVAVNGVLRDITERKKSRDLLESEKDKFQEFFEHLPNYGYIVSPKGKIMDINRRALDRLGYTKEEAIGMPVLKLYTPRSRKKAKVLFDQFIKGESVTGEELDIVTKGGEVRTIQLGVNPVFDETGGLTHSISIQRDVTDWKRAQMEKRAVEARYAELVHNVPVGIYRSETGKNRHVIEANAAAMKIFEAESEEDFAEFDLSHFYQVKEDQALFDEKLKKQGFVKGEELRLFTVKGRRIWCRLTGALTKDNKGVPVFDGMIEDITELKEASVKVRELDLLKSRFITALTHVIRTPLNKIRWSLESLSSGEYGALSDEQQIFVHQALSSESDVLRVISQINTTLDIERGTMTFDKAPMSLVSLIRSVVKQIQSEYPMADIEWTEKISGGEMPPCMIDGEKMRRAIDVLVDNAVHYLKEDDKRIRIEVEKKEKTIRCSVIDSGIGVPATEQLHMFNRFFRASNAQASFPDGMGLGLYIAKAIIDAHGGAIGLKSSEGKGSTFWFELPCET